ncbi:Hypothetical predicted protein [Octopus vulgaris]|uniref:Uncharacterized protein n=1 Tax=Octopus vulgaris TaxID=6645 RepID=A0AA36F932_OCTVU|nr:Hypothetical predicted protein [Octopus vulgaris]
MIVPKKNYVTLIRIDYHVVNGRSILTSRKLEFQCRFSNLHENVKELKKKNPFDFNIKELPSGIQVDENNLI